MTTTPTVLVAYGTRNGSTGGIAGMIADTLRGEGLTAQVRPAAEVSALDGYDAVILGGALYAGRWHRDAVRFARRHATALRERPVWLFSSGPLDDSADGGQLAAVHQVAVAMARTGAAGHVTFGGQLTGQARGFVARAMVRGGKGGDFRNRRQIEDWARSVAAQLDTPSARPRVRQAG
jgi:menaquinone-dependent protoporphyrinogen oxidase